MTWTDPSFLGILISVVLGLLTLFFFCRAFWRRAREHEQTLNGMSSWFNEHDDGISAADLDEASKRFEEHPWLFKAWQEYREGLVEVPPSTHESGADARDASEASPPVSFHNTLTIGEFFTDDMMNHAVQVWRFSYSALQPCPSFATSIGMLGTFLGVTIGLSSLDVHHLDESGGVGSLISSLGSAFITSILGLVTSMALTALNARCESRLFDALGKLREAIERSIPRITAEALMVRGLALTRESNALQRDQRSLIRELRDQGAESGARLMEIADDLAEKLGSRIEGAIGNAFAPQMARMEEQLARVSSSSTDASRTFVEASFRNFSGELERVFVDVGTQLAGFSGQMQRAESTFEGLHRYLDEASAMQRAVLNEAAQAVATSEKRSLGTQNTLAEVGALTQQLTSLAASLETQQQRATQQLGSHAAMQQAHLQDNDMLRSAMQASSTHVTESSKHLRDTLKTLHEQIVHLSDNTRALSQITAQAASCVQSSSQSLEKRSETEIQLVRDFHDITRSFGESMAAGRPLLSSLGEAASATLSVAKRAASMAERLESLEGNLARSSSEVAEGLHAATQGFSSASERIAQVVHGTEAWAVQATGAVERFGSGLNDAVQGSLREYDRSLASAVESLAGAMRDLEDVAAEMAEGRMVRTPLVHGQVTP